MRCLVANTASEAWKFKHLKRKTDKDDALRLAQLYVLDQLPTVTLPPTAIRQWRSLIAVRQALVGRRVAVQNRIRSIFVAQGMPAPRGASAWSASGLAGIAGHAKAFDECGLDELWRGVGTGMRMRPQADIFVKGKGVNDYAEYLGAEAR